MKEIMEQFVSGQLTVATVIMWSALACPIAVLAGALGGLKMGGKDIGNDLAAMMGALFGATAAVPAIFIGLLILAFIRS